MKKGRIMRSTRPILLTFGAVAILVTAVLLGAIQFAAAFSDVAGSTAYSVAIQDLSSRSIVTGFDDGTFRPDAGVKRMQFAKMIVRTMDLPVGEGDVCPFPDVDPSTPPELYPDHYVAVAAAQHITQGYDDGTFGPQNLINRAQVITMVVRAADALHPGLLRVAGGSSTWGDFDATHAANAAKAEANGLLDGLPLASLDPYGPMPRGEVAQVLHNLLGLLADGGPTTTTTAPRGPPLRVDFIDVGQGDSILIRTPEGKVALIDGGDSGSGALAYLRAQGVTRVDLLVATHPHADHIGGLVDILENLPVTKVVTNGVSTTTLTYEHFLDAIAAAQATYVEAKRGDKLELGAFSFDVLSPAGSSSDADLNDGSLVLRLVDGGVAFLFTGDAEATAEAGMLAAGQNVQAQILKIGHHASRTASSPAFLAAVRPKIAVYCAETGNEYGHPHAETLAALAAVGATVYGTDRNGTVSVTTDGVTYQVTTTGDATPVVPPPGGTTTTTQGTTTTTTPGTTTTTTTPALAIQVLSLTSPIARGATATLTVKTSPGANCTITVTYASGPSKAAGLEPKVAGSDGTVSWSWKVGSSTTPGTWSIDVAASTAQGSTSSHLPFVVQ
jgi:competence protein ComEC